MVQSSSISITPATHADRHVIGGLDPLINPLLLHASRHETGGDDIISIPSYTLSDDVLRSNDAEKSSPGSIVVYEASKKTILFNLSGTIRIRFSMKVSHSAQLGYGRIYRNGAAVGTERTTNSISYVTFTEDIAGWSAGDEIAIYYKTNGATTTHIQEFRILGICPVLAVYQELV